MTMPARIKKGDMVLVVAGKDRDLKTPRRVLRVMPKSGRLLVEGVNRIKRHTRPNPQRNVKGGILEREAPIHASNAMPIDPETKRPTRVGGQSLADGKRVRVARRSGSVLDKG
jgi:large subunit ribosomal protein L24